MANIKNTLSLLAGKTQLKLRRSAPDIFLGVGIVTLGASLIGVGKASIKAVDILAEHKEYLDKIETCKADPEQYDYSEEDAVADLKLCYKKTALKMIVTYGPSIALAIVSVGCFVRSNNILKARNAALASTLAGVTKEFKKYRDRVIEKYGKEADEEFRFGTKSVTVTDENGETHKVNVVKENPKDGDYGPYARIFSEGNENWTGNPTFDKMFLEGQERYMNDRLVARGVVFLNDVYKALGFDETPEGQMYGWVYKPGTDEANNVIDFGMRDFTKESSKNFWLGQSDGVVLDFNVDGYILDRIPESF